MICDSHQHFWRPSRGDYYWMNDNPAVDVLRRDFLPGDLAPLRAATGVTHSVLVQAAPTVAETRFLLELADTDDSVVGVVGWIDFENPEDRATLEDFAQHPKFVGVRPMIQDLPDPEWMHRADIQWAFDALVELDIAFDALGFPIHIDPFERLFDRHPDLRVVIDHGMKPEIRDRAYDDWAAGMQRLAEKTAACCKISGLLTEALPGDDAAVLRPYIDHLLQSFGAERCMWGSDWPVLTLVSDYARWFDMARSIVPAADTEAVFGATANRFYRLGIQVG